MIVELISPNNEIYKLNYYEVNDFCKIVCNKEEYKERFKEFQKDYTYFDAYFDFIMFELGYKMHSCLFEKDNIFCKNNQLYSENFSRNNYIMPYITKCSDEVLRIKEVSKVIPNALIDPNGMKMMGKMIEDERGTHITTARTILNQLLIRSKKICEHFIIDSVNPLNELMNIGFIRGAKQDGFEILICREELLSEELKNILKQDKISNYGYAEDIDYELKEEYLNFINSKKIDNKTR